MSSGLYPSDIFIERFQASVSAANLGQLFVAPADLDVLGLVATVGTAPGANDGVIINVSNFPTSQQGGSGAPVSAYNLWTAANAPTILGTSKNSFGTTNSGTVVNNVPYALNYPLPGPSGTKGYNTAQSTVQTTETPVVTPPLIFFYEMNALVAPDNTYTDYNGVTGKPAAHIHAGDVLTFSVAAGGSGTSLGAAANLEIVLFAQKR